VITVKDATTGAPICDATVVVLGAAEGGPIDAATTSNVLTPNAGGVSCRYDGPSLNPTGDTTATFTIQVSKDGYKTATIPNVVTRVSNCSIDMTPTSPQMVNVSLQHI
jgi:hypothetical protein